ncbi:MAG: type II toxin-antitoxin system MqsA family antitoxin [Chloroflexi bacterium]|nr:MAG: type II toxin-antitoxin system MqsA family antitoxin [Chloroflexota bacterium]
MTGKLGKGSRCPLCGGRLEWGTATIPFVLPDTVVLVKEVPAEVCQSCHEPYLTGQAVDHITDLLNRLRGLRAEVLIFSYAQFASTAQPIVAAESP